MRAERIGAATLCPGDCLQVLAGMPEASVDAVLTDPPYGLGFMGKKWDTPGAFVERKPDRSVKFDRVGGNHNPCSPQDAARTRRVEGRRFQEWCEAWAREAFRVLKPGGFIASFASTRTYHRMACALEDAGFIVHPMLGWVFGSGFPKATRVDAEGYDGVRYGLQALKPALEPIFLGQKPFSEKTGTANILKHGTGGLNIDQCRVATDEAPSAARRAGKPPTREAGTWANDRRSAETFAAVRPGEALGRFPPNLLHDGSPEVLAAFEVFGTDKGAGGQASGPTLRDGHQRNCMPGAFNGTDAPQAFYGDRGSPARFYPQLGYEPGELRFMYCAKASRREREAGLEGAPARTKRILNGGIPSAVNSDPRGMSGGGDREARNHHPTVKPLALCRWLCRLITPPNGVVLDCFAGSGSVGVAALQEGMRPVLIEREAEYVDIARRRLEAAVEGFSLPLLDEEPDTVEEEAA